MLITLSPRVMGETGLGADARAYQQSGTRVIGITSAE